MGNANRVLGYLSSCVSASFVYMVWFAVQTGAADSDVTFRFTIGVAFFFWLVGGMAAALVFIAFPWYLAVVWYDRIQRHGVIFFSVFGAAMTTVIGCVTASLAPKPLFVDDQTFGQGFMIAIQRQGIGLLVTGLVFGLTFWFVSERRQNRLSLVPPL